MKKEKENLLFRLTLRARTKGPPAQTPALQPRDELYVPVGKQAETKDWTFCSVFISRFPNRNKTSYGLGQLARSPLVIQEETYVQNCSTSFRVNYMFTTFGHKNRKDV
jgi:hypothetical protein